MDRKSWRAVSIYLSCKLDSRQAGQFWKAALGQFSKAPKANRSVVLYQRTKIKKKWGYRKVSEDLSKLILGDYYLSWYVGSRKRLRSVGSDPKKAIEKLERKRLELAYVAAGGEVKHSDVPLDGQAQRKRVSSAVKDYLEDCADRQGKSGYGLAVRTPEAYEYRLGFLIEFRPEACLDEVNAEFVKAFRRFLRKHPKDLSDRTCYNIMQAVSVTGLCDRLAVSEKVG